MNMQLFHRSQFLRSGSVALALAALAHTPAARGTELLTNPSFDTADGAGWSYAPSGIWAPFATIGRVDLHRSYNPSVGVVTILWQPLDISNVGGATVTASMRLAMGNGTSWPTSGTISTKVYLDYVDASGNSARQLLLSPDNHTVAYEPDGSLFSTSFTLPANAQKITGFSVDRNYSGFFYANEFSLDLQQPPPVIGVESGGVALTSGDALIGFGQSLVGVPESSPVTFTVKNTGAGPLTLTPVTVEGTNASDFVVTQPAVSSVEPQASTTFTVTFTPSALGTRLATLILASNDTTGSPFTIKLTGFGLEPPVLPTVAITSPLADASLASGAAIALEAVVVSSEASISKVEFYDGEALIGAGCPSLNGAWTFSDASTLSVWLMNSGQGYSQGSLDYYDAKNGIMFSYGGSMTSQLAYSGSVYDTSTDSYGYGGINFSFNPDNTLSAEIYGDLVEARTLTGGVGGSSPFTLSWPNASVGTHVLTARAYYGTEQFVTSDTVTISVAATPKIGVEQPENTVLTSGTSSIDFGSSYPGVPISRTFTVKNTGTATLNDILATIDGANAGDYVLTTTPASSLLVGKGMTFTVTFTPTTTDTRAATLSIASSDTTNTPFTIGLTGIGLYPPQVTITSPLAAATFAGGEAISLTAEVAAYGGSVTGLEFYDGTALIGAGQIGVNGWWNFPDGGTLAVHPGAVGNMMVDYTPPGSTHAYMWSGSFPSDPLKFYGSFIRQSGQGMESGQGGVTFSFGSNSTLNASFFGNVLIVNLTGGTCENPKFTLSWSGAAAGTHVLSARAYYGAGVSVTSDPVSISVGSGSTPFQAWMSEKGVLANANPEQSPHGDGVTNLSKFAFNMDPQHSDCRSLKPGGGATAGLPGSSNVGGKLRIEFLRRKASTQPGITYTPQFGSSPGALSDFTGTETSVDTLDSTWERVVVEDPAPAANARFGRLKVELIP